MQDLCDVVDGLKKQLEDAKNLQTETEGATQEKDEELTALRFELQRRMALAGEQQSDQSGCEPGKAKWWWWKSQ